MRIGASRTTDYRKAYAGYSAEAEKLENGETEPSFQIGGQSFTEKEWNGLIDKIDKYIEQVRAEQAERVEKQKEEELEKEQELKKEQEI